MIRRFEQESFLQAANDVVEDDEQSRQNEEMERMHKTHRSRQLKERCFHMMDELSNKLTVA